MRTLRLWLVGTVILMLLGGLSGVVLAQKHDYWPTEWVTPAGWLVFIEGDCLEGDATTITDPAGVEHLRGMPITCDITFSDPRLSGIQSDIFNQDCHASDDGEVCVDWGTQEIVGPDGTWSGWFTGTIGEDGNGHGYTVLAGAGGYEGLTNIR